MSYSQARNDRERVLRTLDDSFQKRMERHKSGISREIQAYLAGAFATDDDGRITFTISNIRTTRTGVRRVFDRFFRAEGIPLLSWLFKRLQQVFAASRRMFSTMKPVEQRKADSALALLMNRLGFNLTNGSLIAGGYLSQVFRMDDVAAQVARDIIQLLPTRPTLARVRERLEQRFFSRGGGGYLNAYFRRFTSDLLFQFDASTQRVMAEQLDLQYFEYSGTIIRTSRCFCERRVNRVYTTQYAEKWNKKQWKGKMKDGDFFIDRGGYNCRHHLSYITAEQARRIMNGRNIKVNTYNNAGCNERTE